MIEEINSTSQTLSKTGKPDDPVSLILLFPLASQDKHQDEITNLFPQQLTKVVRVLNSQLSQLQVIDSGAAQLQEKIEAAQKDAHRGNGRGGSSGWNGLGTDPTEDFYRSFRGSRSDRFGGQA